MTDLKPCPLCDSTNVTCFAEYDGDSYDNVPVYHAVVACLGCNEDGCDPDYDEEPCFGIEAYFRGDHPLIRDCEDPSDCERVLERHMAERWNHRAERTCRDTSNESPHASDFVCSSCGFAYSMSDDMSMLPDEIKYCPNCGAKVVDE